jgi:hypothetical protein
MDSSNEKCIGNTTSTHSDENSSDSNSNCSVSLIANALPFSFELHIPTLLKCNCGAPEGHSCSLQTECFSSASSNDTYQPFSPIFPSRFGKNSTNDCEQSDTENYSEIVSSNNSPSYVQSQDLFSNATESQYNSDYGQRLDSTDEDEFDFNVNKDAETQTHLTLLNVDLDSLKLPSSSYWVSPI